MSNKKTYYQYYICLPSCHINQHQRTMQMLLNYININLKSQGDYFTSKGFG